MICNFIINAEQCVFCIYSYLIDNNVYFYDLKFKAVSKSVSNANIIWPHSHCSNIEVRIQILRTAREIRDFSQGALVKSLENEPSHDLHGSQPNP